MAIVTGCACGTGNGNTGTANCVAQFGLAVGLGTQELVDETGALNEIDISAAIGTTFYDLFTDANTESRIYPISDLRNIDFPQEGVQYDTDNTGQKSFLRDGILSFAGEKRNGNAVYASKLNQGRCIDNGQWIFTKEGVIGVKISHWDADTHVLRPIPVSAFNAEWNPRKGDAVDKVMITFDFAATLNTGELWEIKYADLGMTFDQFKLAGLQDVNFTNTSAVTVGVTTDFDSTLITDYGDGIVSAQNVGGQISADFAGTNRTTGASVTVTSTEVADASYNFDFANQTTADVVRVAFVTTSGFDGYVDVTIP
jgi:hypothetical protein